MDSWLSPAADAVAAAAGLARGELELSESDVSTLLELARVAAHDSGERTNAPLLCYLVGLAAGRTGVVLDRLAASVPRSGD
jgi:pyrrolidone-carboxylate peptidase